MDRKDPMIALSTSWKSSRVDNGEALIEAVLGFKVTGVELEYRITGKMFHQMRTLLKRSGLAIVSIHNYFPAPTDEKGLKPGGDMLSLSNPDRDKRNLAVKKTMGTFEAANDLEAPVVVLHCGFVEMEAEIQALHHYYTSGRIQSPEAKQFIKEKKFLLAGRKGRHLDCLLFSLERLSVAAERLGITIALENRYYYRELPGPEDFGLIFSRLDGAPLGYWHDTGHAHANEVLGWIPEGMLLEKFENRLVGTHLHDARGLEDHLPPGSGEIDFSRVLACLKPGTPRVLELEPGTPDQEVESAIEYLTKMGFADPPNETAS